MHLSLEGRSAIVTGAARGIGFAIAQRLANAGARVLVADIDERSASAAADEIGGVGIHADVTREKDVRAMVQQAIDSFGKLDILVNNAGIAGKAAPIWETSDDDWNRVIDLDLTAVFRCCRAAIV